MAASDYAFCEHCDKKCVYEGNCPVGDAVVFHPECLAEHERKIRADERAKIAAAIRADLVHLDDGSLNPFGQGQEYAARIVEEAGR